MEGQLPLKVLNEPVPSLPIRAWYFLFGPNEAIPRNQHTQAQLCSMFHSRQKASNAENRGWRTQEKPPKVQLLAQVLQTGAGFQISRSSVTGHEGKKSLCGENGK